MRELVQQIRVAFRSLRAQPGLSGIAILALGLGIGFTTIMFSIVYGALYRGLPFPDGDRLLYVAGTNPTMGYERTQISIPDFLEWRAQQTSFEDMAAFYTGTVNVSGGERADRFDGGFMSANAFQVLGVQAALGRGFAEGEDLPGAPRVLVLGDQAWKEQFGQDPSVIGRAVRVNGEPATIVGVMPPGFRFPESQEIWTNLPLDPAGPRAGGNTVGAYGKLRAGVTLAQAQEELSEIARRIEEIHPDTNKGLRALVNPFTENYVNHETASILLSMLAVVVLVLVVACVNVANLLLARTAGRTKELAIRTALGANRARILGQLVVEAAVLAFFGAALGIGIAHVGIGFFARAVVNTDPPFWLLFTLDGPILVFAVAISALAALISGVIPGVKATGTRVNEVLKDASRGSSSLKIGRLSRALVIAEVTMSVGLLVTAGQMVKGLVEIKTTDYGFDRQEVLTARLGLFPTDFPDVESRRQAFRELRDRLIARPEIRDAALTDRLPGLAAERIRFQLPGVAYADEQSYPTARLARITPGFFETFGTSVVRGRAFTEADATGAPQVAVVNESFVQRYFPNADALGEQIRLAVADQAGESGSERGTEEGWLTVVGVAPDLVMEGVGNVQTDGQGIYLPLGQADAQFVSIALRGSGPALSLAGPVRQEMAAIDPDSPLYWVRSMQEALDEDNWAADVFGTLFGIFGLGALFLAAVGLYGVMAFSVRSRTQEVGVRIAMGAKGGDVMGMVLRMGLVRVVIGLVLGLGLGGLLSQLLKGMMRMNPWDPALFAVVSTVLLATGLLASFVPAQRATRVSPVEALRER